MKFTPVEDCVVVLILGSDTAGMQTFPLKAGIEYQVTITEDQFIFKSEGTTRIE